MTTEEETIVLRAEDLIPERQRCARSEDDQDTRYCRECLQKPCRWFQGWRPPAPRVPPPELCGACGMKHYPGEPGFTPQDCPGWQPSPDPRVLAEANIACDSLTPTNMTRDHLHSRKVLFGEVDKLIRGRVKTILPAITLEFKRQLDRDLGLDALRQRMQRVSEGVDKHAQMLERDVEAKFQDRIDAILERMTAHAATGIVADFERRIAKLVAKECARQLSLIMGAAKPAKKKRKATR